MKRTISRLMAILLAVTLTLSMAPVRVRDTKVFLDAVVDCRQDRPLGSSSAYKRVFHRAGQDIS